MSLDLFDIRDSEHNIVIYGFTNKNEARRTRNQLKKDCGKDYFITVGKDHWKNGGSLGFIEGN